MKTLTKTKMSHIMLPRVLEEDIHESTGTRYDKTCTIRG